MYRIKSSYQRPSSFFFSVYRRPTDPNFWQFQKKKKKEKSNDVVTPFFTWNNSFNLKNEHSNSIEKKKFFRSFFFNPTENQETHSTVNEGKKGDGQTSIKNLALNSPLNRLFLGSSDGQTCIIMIGRWLPQTMPREISAPTLACTYFSLKYTEWQTAGIAVNSSFENRETRHNSTVYKPRLGVFLTRDSTKR